MQNPSMMGMSTPFNPVSEMAGQRPGMMNFSNQQGSAAPQNQGLLRFT